MELFPPLLSPLLNKYKRWILEICLSLSLLKTLTCERGHSLANVL